MALFECPECKKEISDKAAACPHCGAPVPRMVAHETAEPHGVSGKMVFLGIAAFLLVVMIATCKRDEPPQKPISQSSTKNLLKLVDPKTESGLVDLININGYPCDTIKEKNFNSTGVYEIECKNGNCYYVDTKTGGVIPLQK